MHGHVHSSRSESRGKLRGPFFNHLELFMFMTGTETELFTEKHWLARRAAGALARFVIVGNVS